MRVFGHIACICALVLAFFGVPCWLGGVNLTALVSGSTDLVSSATAIQEAPSGHYTIFVNKNLHTDEEVLGLWKDFFAGKDVPLIMEDVTCVTANGDTAGIEMAQSLASRLPANQMKVRTEDGTLAISKAEVGRFDIMVLSSETAASLDTTSLERDSNVEVVYR